MHPIRTPLFAAALFVLSSQARADDVLHVGTASLDPPTVTALGVQLLVTGDDNHNASVTVRYRRSGSAGFSAGLPLFRVRPEVVTGRTVPEQFAGSVFDLSPGAAYDIELHAVDADGAIDQTVTVTGTTRPVPRTAPATPRAVAVGNVAALNAALNAAKAGDVITLADGTYAGNFSVSASGTIDDPIVIRGTTRDGTILDGGGCDPCNILEAYGSFVHIENLTLAHASRALRFQGQGAQGNVVRRVHIKDTVLGIGSKADQKDFYLCDNVLEGRLAWPAVYSDDGGAHSNDDGINVAGTGHVVCHNEIRGYGDAMKTEQDGARAVDFYGNEVLSAYDNGLELDASEGNTRALRNRFTNTYATLSFQPIFGGPVYALRNVVVNVANEQMKFHALGTTPPQEPSGVFVYHNTFVSPKNALANYTSAASHHFVIENNLFVASAGGRTVDWTGTVNDGTFDYNGYAPDGVFDFTWGTLGYVRYSSLAEARTAIGIETHGIILTSPIFASALAAPADYTSVLAAADVALDPVSNAIDRGLVLANVNDGFLGAGPDLGALERGCPSPIYGPRPDGVDETSEPLGCETQTSDAGTDATGPVTPADGGSAGAAGATGSGGAGGGAGGVRPPDAATGGFIAGAPESPPGEESGCGCRTARTTAAFGWLWLLAVALTARRIAKARGPLS